MKGRTRKGGSDVSGNHRRHALGHTAKAAGFKVGGMIGLPKKKTGGKIGGNVAKHKAGGFARGGKMTPSSPLSGAQVKEKSFVNKSIPKEDTGGEGGDSR